MKEEVGNGETSVGRLDVKGCSVQDCFRPHYQDNFCHYHYCKSEENADGREGAADAADAPETAGASASYDDAATQDVWAAAAAKDPASLVGQAVFVADRGACRVLSFAAGGFFSEAKHTVRFKAGEEAELALWDGENAGVRFRELDVEEAGAFAAHEARAAAEAAKAEQAATERARLEREQADQRAAAAEKARLRARLQRAEAAKAKAAEKAGNSKSKSWFQTLTDWLATPIGLPDTNYNFHPGVSDISGNDNSNFYKSGTVYACINGHQINSHLITSKCPFCGKPMFPKY